MIKQEEIRQRIYDIVLAARTEGIVGGKTKWFAEGDAEDILNYLHSQDVAIRGKSLGITHPHLANYYTFKPLIEVPPETTGEVLHPKEG